MIVDSHQHFWDPADADYPWMTDEVAPIRRPYMPWDLRPLLAEAGVDYTVVVQARSDLEETRELLRLAAGTDFVASSVVRWNGADRATTFIGSTEVRAAIAGGDTGAAGTNQVTVFNPPPGGGTSNSSAFTVSSSAFSLTVTIKGSASGTVTSDPSGINCPSICAATFSVSSVALAASPAAGAT